MTPDALETLVAKLRTSARAARPHPFRSLGRLIAPLFLLSGVLAGCGGGGSTTDATTGEGVRETRQAVSGSPGVTAQYVRLQALSEVGGNPWASMAEFNLVDANGATLPRSGWTVAVDSQEIVGENGAAANAIDGDSNSFWHTQWQGGSPAMPHTFTVNLGAPRTFAAFRHLPRQVGTNGRIAAYRFFTSSDNSTWTLAAEGTFPAGAAETTVSLSTAPVVAPIANRMDPVGRAVSQSVVGTDANGGTLTYTASGLPAGTAIDAQSGLVSGMPTTVGAYAPTVQVSNGRASASTSFAWTIAVAGGVGITGRYVRLEATSEVNGNPWASVADFNVVDAGGSTIARTGWKATADSEELVGEKAPASNAIDGDPNSFWHTQWQGGSPQMPHALTVDLGAVRSIGGFRYLPRQSGVNGRIAGYRFYTSTNGTAWTLATSGVFPAGAAESTVRLTGRANTPPVLGVLAARSDPQGQSVVQSVVATDADGDRLTFTATGLPTGLAIDAATGTVSGTPTASGTFAVTVTVGDGVDTATASFTWTITAPGSAVGARYVRLEATSEVNGNPWTSMAEFNLVDGSGATLSRSGWTVVADSQETVAEKRSRDQRHRRRSEHLLAHAVAGRQRPDAARLHGQPRRDAPGRRLPVPAATGRHQRPHRRLPLLHERRRRVVATRDPGNVHGRQRRRADEDDRGGGREPQPVAREPAFEPQRRPSARPPASACPRPSPTATR